MNPPRVPERRAARSSSGPKFRSGRTSVGLSIPPPVRIQSNGGQCVLTKNTTATKSIERPKNISIRTQRAKASPNTSKISEEDFWEESAALWCPVAESDIDYLEKLLKEQEDGFNAFLQAMYMPFSSSEPLVRRSDYDDLLLTAYKRPYPAPPPAQTTRSFCGTRSIAHAWAQRGGVDEMLWNDILGATSPVDCKINENNSQSGTTGIDISACLGASLLDLCSRETFSQTQNALESYWPVLQHHRIGTLRLSTSNKKQGSSLSTSGYRSRMLGKRGRLYDDQWGEEDYMYKYGARCKYVSNWDELLKDYCDDHDGCYIDWLLENLHKRRRMHQYDASVASTQTGGTSVPGTRRTGAASRVATVNTPVHFYPPPVPVAVQHPASWGPGSRVARNQSAIAVGRIHPACVSSTIVKPVGYRTQFVDRKRSADTVVCSDDFDEISLLMDAATRQLEVQSTWNSITLYKILASAKSEIGLQQLREKRNRLHSVVQTIMSDMQKKRADDVERTVSEMLSNNTITSGSDSPQRAAKISNSDRTKSVYAPLCSIPISMNSKRTDFVGAVGSTQLAFGEFLKSLRVGSVVEVYGVGNVWSCSTVIGMKYDYGGALRFLQTRSVGACDGDCQWAAVEDGKLAPPGTHLPQFMVKVASSSIACTTDS
mmetsp:Transcript_13070/g.19710  ORF Transcript_13070/g.19710 Transcript_13070/m.19710 type:complete len:656 (+) Transcript_13070:26-1993(+)